MITKEQVLNNLDEVKKYIAEAETKKEDKVVGIAIKSVLGSIRFQSTKTTYKEAVVEAVASNADLRYADLRGANLSDAELNCVKFYGRGGTKPLKRSQLPSFLGALGFIIED